MKRTIVAAMGAALAMSSVGCSFLTRSEANQIQSDIRDIKLELNRLKETSTGNDQKIMYSLNAIEEKLDVRHESLGSTLRDVDERLADMMARPPEGAAPGGAPMATGIPPASTSSLGAPTAPATPSATAGTLTPTPAASASPLAGISPEDAYLEATKAWTAQDIDRAQVKYEQFVQAFPKHPRAGDALFWVGECHYSKGLGQAKGAGELPAAAKGEFLKAIEVYQKVLKDYPGCSYESEAAAKIGYCYYYLKDNENARKALQLVLDRYPTYPQTERVKETLATLP
ncbi:MAG: tetratricopeptide repeat protein [Candidatus Sumerlaeota bacterium]|nr:tetratricopeptide repeat protein [Candidatus Sumerlaeota bacterium]